MTLIKPVFAEDINLKPPAGSDFARLGDLTAPRLISTAISGLMLVVALVFFFILILGGLKWVTSEGDEKKVSAARSQITNGLIGLAIVFAAFAIMKLIGAVFEVDIFNFKIPKLTG